MLQRLSFFVRKRSEFRPREDSFTQTRELNVTKACAGSCVFVWGEDKTAQTGVEIGKREKRGLMMMRNRIRLQDTRTLSQKVADQLVCARFLLSKVLSIRLVVQVFSVRIFY